MLVAVLSFVLLAFSAGAWAGDCRDSVISALDQLRSALGDDPRVQSFVRENRELTEVTAADNAAYIRLAQKQFEAANKDPRLVFVHGEYTVLKEMNDKRIQDKPVIDAFYIDFKKNLLREERNDPALSQSLVGKASQGKLTELVFRADDKSAIERRFQNAYARAALTEDRTVRNSPVFPLVENASGYAGQPSKWFLFGFGNTQEEAEIAARELKSAPEAQGSRLARIASFSDPRVRSQIQDSVRRISSLRQELEMTKPEIFEAGTGAKRTLAKRVISVLRSTSGEDLQAYLVTAQKRFHDELGVDISIAELGKLKEYFNLADKYSLSRIEEAPARVPFETARGTIMTDDLKGQGVENINILMRNMTRLEVADPDPSELVRLARLSEQEATEGMRKVSDQFFSVSKGAKYGSGDDRYAFVEGVLPMQERKRQIIELAAHGDPDRHRPTYTDHLYGDTGEPVPTEKLSALSVRAEKLEKELQTDPTLLHLVPKDMIFAISQLPMSDGSAEVRIITSGRLVPALEPIIRNRLQNFFRQANLKFVGFL
jgi:hypothetical protein